MSYKTISELPTLMPGSAATTRIPVETAGDNSQTGKMTLDEAVKLAQPVMMVQGLITDNGDTITLNKTWAEIRTAFTSGKFVFIVTAESAVTGMLDEFGIFFITSLFTDTEDGYIVVATNINGLLNFKASSSSGTLVYTTSDEAN